MGILRKASEPSLEGSLKKNFGIPSIFTDSPHIEITDNRQIILEGSKGVQEYSDNIIRVSLGQYSVSLSGRGMTLKCISDSVLVIEGFLMNIEFCM